MGYQFPKLSKPLPRYRTRIRYTTEEPGNAILRVDSHAELWGAVAHVAKALKSRPRFPDAFQATVYDRQKGPLWSIEILPGQPITEIFHKPDSVQTEPLELRGFNPLGWGSAAAVLNAMMESNP